MHEVKLRKLFDDSRVYSRSASGVVTSQLTCQQNEQETNDARDEGNKHAAEGMYVRWSHMPLRQEASVKVEHEMVCVWCKRTRGQSQMSQGRGGEVV